MKPQTDKLIEKILEEFNGLELRTTQGRPPYDIVVNRQQVKDWLSKILSSYKSQIIKELQGQYLWTVKTDNKFLRAYKKEILKEAVKSLPNLVRGYHHDEYFKGFNQAIDRIKKGLELKIKENKV